MAENLLKQETSYSSYFLVSFSHYTCAFLFHYLWYFWMLCIPSLIATCNVTLFFWIKIMYLLTFYMTRKKWKKKSVKGRLFRYFYISTWHPGLHSWDWYQCMTSSGSWKRDTLICVIRERFLNYCMHMYIAQGENILIWKQAIV